MKLEKYFIKAVLATVILGVILSLSALAYARFAHPFTIKCPIDGGSMSFDHQVGFGDDATCWYSHYGTDPQTGEYGKHEAYIPCGD